ncbi:unnamed protein product [Merluccius merluccius]
MLLFTFQPGLPRAADPAGLGFHVAAPSLTPVLCSPSRYALDLGNHIPSDYPPDPGRGTGSSSVEERAGVL